MAHLPQDERFLALMEEHKRILYKVANSYCPDLGAREDLIHEMVLALWRSFPRYDETRRFSTWMYRIALNVAIDFHRGEARRQAVTAPLDDSALAIAATGAESGDRDADIEQLQRFIAQLNEVDRALVILHLDGNRYDAIAEVLGISETNVGTRLGRIKEKLRRVWAAHEDQETTRWNSTT